MEIRNYAANGMTNDTNSINSRNSDLSVNDFLQIMAAEIKNQTPFDSEGNGGSSSNYLSQMAQLTTLEHIGTIIDSINVLSLMNQQEYTFGLIGKEVTVIDGEEEVTGLVDRVRFENGYAVIQIENKNYQLGSIVEVAKPEVSE